MRKSRKQRQSEGRDRVTAWLDSRTNFERVPPAGRSASTFGLARMRRLLAAIGDPHRRLRVVHVAGTKGKGSTVAMLAAVLEEAGHRVGRYMSPHVHALEERIAVDGRPIPTADLVAAFERLIPAVEEMDRRAARRGGRGPTWFEVMTAAAFLHFVRSRVDIAVLETGLGGRLDATNVVQPLLSIITSISLDHMAVLGPTIRRIAAEKAGIIKRGRPVISTAMHPAAQRVIAATAARRRATLWQLGRDIQVTSTTSTDAPLDGGIIDVTVAPGRRVPSVATGHYRLGMSGRHQADNAAAVVAAAVRLEESGVRVPPQALARGLARVRLPARIERLGERPLVIVDAAHNVASMRSLLETVSPTISAKARRVLVFAASGDKQIETMLGLAAGHVDEVILTRYVSNRRAAPPERLLAAASAAGLPAAVIEPPAAAVREARTRATRRGAVLIAGSFFLAAEVGRTF